MQANARPPHSESTAGLRLPVEGPRTAESAVRATALDSVFTYSAALECGSLLPLCCRPACWPGFPQRLNGREQAHGEKRQQAAALQSSAEEFAELDVFFHGFVAAGEQSLAGAVERAFDHFGDGGNLNPRVRAYHGGRNGTRHPYLTLLRRRSRGGRPRGPPLLRDQD